MKNREWKSEWMKSLASLGLLAALALSTTLATPALAQGNGSRRLVVPLTDPSQPVKLEVGLMMGSIRIEAHEGSEVIVTATMEEVEEEIEQVDGMFRIPNTGMGLEIEERNNRVEISTGMMSREIELSILVPRETSMEASTVNGGVIVVEGVTGELELNNVNGPI